MPCSELCRAKKVSKWWGKGIWDNFLPTKISFFLWKVLWGRLAMEDRIKQMGIALPSKCMCCKLRPQSEDAVHLLFEGEWATMCWKWLINIFQMRNKADKSFFQWLQVLFQRSKESFVQKFRRVLAAVMLWEIWKARCSSKYGGKEVKVSQIFLNIKNWTDDLAFLMQGMKCYNPKGARILLNLNIASIQPVKEVNTIVYWFRPPFKAYKLNVDGATRRNPGPGEGGGIIRDHNGDLVAAFSNYYGKCTNTIAEFQALKDGLSL